MANPVTDLARSMFDMVKSLIELIRNILKWVASIFIPRSEPEQAKEPVANREGAGEGAHSRQWTDEEREELKHLHRQGLRDDEIAKRLNRSIEEVQMQRKKDLPAAGAALADSSVFRDQESMQTRQAPQMVADPSAVSAFNATAAADTSDVPESMQTRQAPQMITDPSAVSAPSPADPSDVLAAPAVPAPHMRSTLDMQSEQGRRSNIFALRSGHAQAKAPNLDQQRSGEVAMPKISPFAALAKDSALKEEQEEAEARQMAQAAQTATAAAVAPMAVSSSAAAAAMHSAATTPAQTSVAGESETPQALETVQEAAQEVVQEVVQDVVQEAPKEAMKEPAETGPAPQALDPISEILKNAALAPIQPRSQAVDDVQRAQAEHLRLAAEAAIGSLMAKPPAPKAPQQGEQDHQELAEMAEPGYADYDRPRQR